MGNHQTYYARKERDGLYVIRQYRYRDQLRWGKEHPNDVMAYGKTVDDLKATAARFFGSTDFSEVEGEP